MRANPIKLYDFSKGSTFTKKESFDLPYGIAITVPIRFFEEGRYTRETFARFMLGHMNQKEDAIWYQTICAIPKLDVGFVYLVIDGIVMYRLSIVEYLRNQSITFYDCDQLKSFEKKNWVTLCGPVIKAPHNFLMRGFQGFRYTSEIF